MRLKLKQVQSIVAAGSLGTGMRLGLSPSANSACRIRVIRKYLIAFHMLGCPTENMKVCKTTPLQRFLAEPT